LTIAKTPYLQLIPGINGLQPAKPESSP